MNGRDYQLSNALGYSISRYNSDLGVLQIGIRAKVIENQEADEKLSDGGSPQVIVYGYDGLPMQPVAPPSPDYIPGPEEPHTPPVPQDEDERAAITSCCSPTAESPGYVVELDPEEDPKEYEDMRTEDVFLLTISMDVGEV
ncbi:hypothetical protein Tco_0764610 [Tanacetum coccineum]